MAFDTVQFPHDLVDKINALSDEPILHGAADGDLALNVGDNYVRVVPPAASTTTVTLPGVMAAKGEIYLIESIGNDTGTITVEEQEDAVVAFADVVLTADLDHIMVRSTGTKWLTVDEVST